MGNVISGNMGNGVLLRGRDASQNLVQGNLIDVDVGGTEPLGNTGHGVSLTGLSLTGNVIGGMQSDEGNVIAFNGGAGVSVQGGNAQGNAIHSNAELGIDLNNDGVTPNDPGDADSGPNGLQNFPEIQLCCPQFRPLRRFSTAVSLSPLLVMPCSIATRTSIAVLFTSSLAIPRAFRVPTVLGATFRIAAVSSCVQPREKRRTTCDSRSVSSLVTVFRILLAVGGRRLQQDFSVRVSLSSRLVMPCRNAARVN